MSEDNPVAVTVNDALKHIHTILDWLARTKTPTNEVREAFEALRSAVKPQ